MADGKTFTPKHLALLKYLDSKRVAYEQGAVQSEWVTLKRLESEFRYRGARVAVIEELDELRLAGALRVHPSSGVHYQLTVTGQRWLKKYSVKIRQTERGPQEVVVATATGNRPRVEARAETRINELDDFGEDDDLPPARSMRQREEQDFRDQEGGEFVEDDGDEAPAVDPELKGERVRSFRGPRRVPGERPAADTFEDSADDAEFRKFQAMAKRLGWGPLNQDGPAERVVDVSEADRAIGRASAARQRARAAADEAPEDLGPPDDEPLLPGADQEFEGQDGQEPEFVEEPQRRIPEPRPAPRVRNRNRNRGAAKPAPKPAPATMPTTRTPPRRVVPPQKLR